MACCHNSAASGQLDSEIHTNGLPRKYVTRRIYNDSQALLCIPDQMLVKLRASGMGHFKLVYGIASFVADPYTITPCIQIEEPTYTLVVRGHAYTAQICPSSPPTDERPPARPV